MYLSGDGGNCDLEILTCILWPSNAEKLTSAPWHSQHQRKASYHQQMPWNFLIPCVILCPFDWKNSRKTLNHFYLILFNFCFVSLSFLCAYIAQICRWSNYLPSPWVKFMGVCIYIRIQMNTWWTNHYRPASRNCIPCKSFALISQNWKL